MKRKLIIVVAVIISILIAGCSKSDPAPPVTPPITNPPPSNPPPVTPPPTNPPPPPAPCDTCGITVVRGVETIALFFSSGQPNWLQSDDELGSSLKLDLVSSGTMLKSKLVNANKGTLTVVPQTGTNVNVRFSNINNYVTATAAIMNTPDTAGKIQIWIYRDDRKDMIAASNGKPAINKIIQVPGKANNVVSSGDIALKTFPGNQSDITAAYMTNLFAQPNWKLLQYNRRD